MSMALEVAKNPGLVEPNPQVGAVVVKDGRVVARGRHEHFGGPHAEVNALRKAGRGAQGGTLYVNLEPCCTHGKTPPCTDAVIAAKVAQVVIGAPDPTQGEGGRLLSRAGIRVIRDVLREESLRLNAPFYKLRLQRRPYVIAKWAMTLDGKIATRTGDSRWISCETSRARVHAVRSVVDGVLVGVGTVLADDPALTARPGKGALSASGLARREALLGKARAAGKPVYHRIVLDARARTPLNSVLARTARRVKTLIAVTDEAGARRRRLLEQAGCEIARCKGTGGRVDIDRLLRLLGERNLTNILVEGGSETLGSFFDAGAVDQLMVFAAPKIAGGAEAFTPAAGRGAARMAEALAIRQMRAESCGSDVLIEGYLREASDYLTTGKGRGA